MNPSEEKKNCIIADSYITRRALNSTPMTALKHEREQQH